MDARLDPGALLGFGPGDAHVIRNAGGIASDDAIRSLALSQHTLGTEEIVVIQHTDCGLLRITDDQFAQHLEDHCGQRPDWSAQAFDDLEANVRASVQLLRESPYLLHPNVRGYIYDVDTEELQPVE